MNDLFEKPMSKGAIISDCGIYRYLLWRTWDEDEPVLLVIGLNPSTADETADDPTIRRCVGYAKTWGYGGLRMVNLFAYRATSPDEMIQYPDPVGDLNDEIILDTANDGITHATLVAWGNRGSHLDRDKQVLRLITHEPYCLRVTAQGQPEHPLYLRKDLRAIPYEK